MQSRKHNLQNKKGITNMRNKTVAYVRCTEIYNDSRATKELLALSNAGYSIIVIGWNRNGLAEEECEKRFRNITNMSFIFFNLKIPGRLGIKNIHKMIHWFLFVLKTLKKQKYIDVIHACDLDCSLPCYFFCKKNKVKLVCDIYDYYIDTHSLPSIAERIVERLEIQTINYSSLTIICTEERKEQIIKSNPRNLIVIHNSPDISNVDINNAVISYDYVYCGGLFQGRLLEEIIAEYKNYSHLKFSFSGNGLYSNNAQECANTYPNFEYNGPISYEHVLDIEARALCLSAIYEPTCRNHRLCAPNKFYESLALGKPVIVCKGTGIDKIVLDNRIGVVINYDVDEFYQAVEWLKKHPEECKEMSVRAKQLYTAKYQWKHMEAILIASYEKILS